jgi:hypothetical protein
MLTSAPSSFVVLLACWLAFGTPAAVALRRFDRVSTAVLVWFVGPLAWCAWWLARRHHTEQVVRRSRQRLLIDV